METEALLLKLDSALKANPAQIALNAKELQMVLNRVKALEYALADMLRFTYGKDGRNSPRALYSVK